MGLGGMGVGSFIYSFIQEGLEYLVGSSDNDLRSALRELTAERERWTQPIVL